MQDEAIDELAKFIGVGDQIAEATRQAMNGGMRFRLKETTKRRMTDLIQALQRRAQHATQHHEAVSTDSTEIRQFLQTKSQKFSLLDAFINVKIFSAYPRNQRVDIVPALEEGRCLSRIRGISILDLPGCRPARFATLESEILIYSLKIEK